MPNKILLDIKDLDVYYGGMNPASGWRLSL